MNKNNVKEKPHASEKPTKISGRMALKTSLNAIFIKYFGITPNQTNR